MMFLYLIIQVVSESPVVLPFVSGGSCERNFCDVSATFCSSTLAGVYRYLGPACATGSSCTACSLDAAGATVCTCETKPFTRGSVYGQPCSPASECVDGSLCFRPCPTFLYLDYCPSDRCFWNYLSSTCDDFSVKTVPPLWSVIAPFGSLNPQESQRGSLIVRFTPETTFPMYFSDLKTATANYMFQGLDLLGNVIPINDLFFMLDINGDGQIDVFEFVALPEVLASIQVDTGIYRSLLAAVAAPTCPELTFWCPISQSCVSACDFDCDYLNTALEGTCTIASISNCSILSLFFCPSKNACTSNCFAECPSANYSDSLTNVCRAPWWLDDTVAPICRSERKSTGQSCVADFDCVDGSKQCISGRCAATTDTCLTDRDCEPLSQYCATDSLGGQDSSSVCVSTGSACVSDTQCSGLSRCNFGACVPLFSLGINALTSSPLLCESASVDLRVGRCTKKIVSLRLGQSCMTDTDCLTSTLGLPSTCISRNWWESASESCRICGPLLSDFSRNSESLKSWLFHKGINCGNQWTDAECVREVPDIASFYYAYKCEEQKFGGGIVLPSSTVCKDEVVDYCIEVV